MNREMRVGIVVFFAIAFLGGLVFVSGGARFRQYGYSFGIVFPDAMGLDSGAPVLVSGVESGKVDGIELMDKGVLVKVSVKDHVIIPADSKFQIDTGGLLGEPRVKVRRGSSYSSVAQGDVVPGTIPPAFDEILQDIRQSLNDVQGTFANINSFLNQLSDTATGFQGLSKEAGDQMKRVGDSIVNLSSKLDSVVDENRESLSVSLRTLSTVLDNFRVVMAQFDEGDSSGKDLRQTVVRIGEAAKSVEELAEKIEGAFFNGEQDSGTTTIKNIKTIVGKANRIISDIEDLYFEGTIGLHGVTSGQSEGDTLADISIWAGSRSRNIGFLFGAEEIGADPGVTAAIGFSNSWLRAWGGAVRGYPGAGFMFFPAGEKGNFSLGAQWWNQNGGHWSLDGRYFFKDKWGLFYRYLDQGSAHTDSAGIFYRF
ncbi:MAG: MlaD family protein [Thermovirgaceae bacterium]|nr:MlaD family protein [Thermovirgaceae bacterium]